MSNEKTNKPVNIVISGDQVQHGFGYGYELTTDITDLTNEQDIWDSVEDDYPLLDFNVSGNYWDKNGARPSLVTILANTKEARGYQTANVNDILEVSIEGKQQLASFANHYNIRLEPSWFIWSYRG